MSCYSGTSVIIQGLLRVTGHTWLRKLRKHQLNRQIEHIGIFDYDFSFLQINLSALKPMFVEGDFIWQIHGCKLTQNVRKTISVEKYFHILRVQVVVCQDGGKRETIYSNSEGCESGTVQSLVKLVCTVYCKCGMYVTNLGFNY